MGYNGLDIPVRVDANRIAFGRQNMYFSIFIVMVWLTDCDRYILQIISRACELSFGLGGYWVLSFTHPR